VCDLDNTLWGGILGDVGLEGLELGETGVGAIYRGIQRFLLGLRNRGLLLAVCSKNREELAHQAFAQHPDMVLRPSDIACFVANFDDKVTNITRIAEELGIGLDSLLFLDDSPFERDFVRTALPQVQVPELPEDPADFMVAFARWNLFETSRHTPTDVDRTALYRGNSERRRLEANATDLDGYLRGLEMRAEFRELDGFSLPRAAELLKRSNQFNLTTLRHPESRLQQFADSESADVFTIRLHDRLGDNGIVAVVVTVAEDEDLVVDSWVMSCRVLGRGVESVTINGIVRRGRERSCARIRGRFRPTAKNGMVADLYPGFGFARDGEVDGTQEFVLPVEGFSPLETHIRVER
jgi:FkbH-like protein